MNSSSKKSGLHCALIGTGQIGTFALRSLTEAGWSVTAADLSPAASFVRRFARTDCTIHALDVTDAGMVDAFFDLAGPCDTVIFAAGLTGQKALADPRLAADVLLKGTTFVAAAMRSRGISRLVSVSSLAVYGAGDDLNEPLKDIAVPRGAVGAYGSLIRRMEAAIAAIEGISVGILRAAGVFGPNRYGHGSHSSQLIERLLYSAALEIPVTLQGHWEDRDDFIYARDVGAALEAAARHNQRQGCEITNVGTGRATSLHELVEAVREVAGGLKINLVPPDPPRPPLKRQPLDVTQMLECIGPPKFTLTEALRDFAREVDLLPERT